MIAPKSTKISPAVQSSWERAAEALSLDIDAAPRRRPAKPDSMAGRIEHTLLGIGPSDADVKRLCAEAAQHQFRGVCCMPRDVETCARLLEGTGVLVVTVVDFPLSGGLPGDAAAQARSVVSLGASEVDMVLDVRAVLAGELAVARDKIARVVEASGPAPVKVIFETGLLNDEQKAAAVAASESGGATFLKTCTGFGPRGASEEDVIIMRTLAGDRMGVKASGGVRTRDDAERLVTAGADVLGTSSGVALI